MRFQWHVTTTRSLSPLQPSLLTCGRDFLLNHSLLHRPGLCSEAKPKASLISPASSWLLSTAPSNCLTLWLYFPDSPWCFLPLRGCLKAMPYPQAAALITGGHTNTCVHTALETAGALGTWNTYIKEKHCDQLPWRSQCLRHLLLKFVLGTDCVCTWVCVRDTVDTLMEADGSRRRWGLPQFIEKEN